MKKANGHKCLVVGPGEGIIKRWSPRAAVSLEEFFSIKTLCDYPLGKCPLFASLNVGAIS